MGQSSTQLQRDEVKPGNQRPNQSTATAATSVGDILPGQLTASNS
jgi:hypothetical protein